MQLFQRLRWYIQLSQFLSTRFPWQLSWWRDLKWRTRGSPGREQHKWEWSQSLFQPTPPPNTWHNTRKSYYHFHWMCFKKFYRNDVKHWCIKYLGKVNKQSTIWEVQERQRPQEGESICWEFHCEAGEPTAHIEPKSKKEYSWQKSKDIESQIFSWKAPFWASLSILYDLPAVLCSRCEYTDCFSDSLVPDRIIAV